MKQPPDTPIGSTAAVAVRAHPSEVVTGLTSLTDATHLSSLGLDDGVAALEQVRRVESWLAWAKHRLAGATMRAAELAHATWTATHPVFDDMIDASADEFGAWGASQRGSAGLARQERLALAERSGVAEIACALRVSESDVVGLLSRDQQFADTLAATAEALRDGSVTGAAASAIAAAAAKYAEDLAPVTDAETDDALTAAVATTEAVLLDRAARGATPGQLAARARQLREQCHPMSFRERHLLAMTDRCVRVRPDRDGMSRLSALLPTATARQIHRRLTAIARQLHDTQRDEAAAAAIGATLVAPERPPEYPPTVGQLRADVLADLLGGLTGRRPDPCGNPLLATIAAPFEGSAVRDAGWERSDEFTGPDDAQVPHLTLTIPASTLLSGDDAPGWLGELGPIAAAEARYLASLATGFSLAVIAGADDAGPQPTGSPPMVFPPTASPPTGFPPTASPPPGFPPMVYPPTASPPTGFPPTASPPTGFPPTASPPTGFPPTVPASSGPPSAGPPSTVLPASGPPPAADPPWKAMPITGVVSDGSRVPSITVIPVAVTDGRRYRIPAALRRALVLRDGTCRFPGCRRAASRCDIDHVTAWADGGATEADNLAHLCRRHHVLKHHSGWSVVAESARRAPVPGGNTEKGGVAEDERVGSSSRTGRFAVVDEHRAAARYRWTSPAGRQYVSDPEAPPF